MIIIIYLILLFIIMVVAVKSTYRDFGKLDGSIIYLVLISLLFVAVSLALYITDRMEPPKHDLICIDNVEYINVFDAGTTPHFKSDGTIYTCE